MKDVIRQLANVLMGKPVYVHHKSGVIYHGQLQSVTHKGIYVLPYHQQPLTLMSDSESGDISLCEPHTVGTEAQQQVFLPAMFFTFGALSGLAAARPPYYGYGYGGYPGYPW